ncbi:hypothetical protein FS749_011313 [Ceratobasidium sp. UAMH 11750]|nr:hypothetical protein FS749_011313 [Ceratobasidium sp. UAMH 11750]
MHIITLNFDPLDCTCWLLPDREYCTYCNAVCEAALQDYENGVGEWLTLGAQSVYKLAQEAEHQPTLAELFEEDQAPTPISSTPVEPNFMEDLGEELPRTGTWRSKRVKGKGKENQCPRILAWGSQSVDKPYARASGKGRKGALDLYLVLLR